MTHRFSFEKYVNYYRNADIGKKSFIYEAFFWSRENRDWFILKILHSNITMAEKDTYICLNSSYGAQRLSGLPSTTLTCLQVEMPLWTNKQNTALEHDVRCREEILIDVRFLIAANFLHNCGKKNEARIEMAWKAQRKYREVGEKLSACIEYLWLMASPAAPPASSINHVEDRSPRNLGPIVKANNKAIWSPWPTPFSPQWSKIAGFRELYFFQFCFFSFDFWA